MFNHYKHNGFKISIEEVIEPREGVYCFYEVSSPHGEILPISVIGYGYEEEVLHRIRLWIDLGLPVRGHIKTDITSPPQLVQKWSTYELQNLREG